MYEEYDESEMKSSHDDVLSAVPEFLDQWDPSTATSTEKVCRLQEDYVVK